MHYSDVKAIAGPAVSALAMVMAASAVNCATLNINLNGLKVGVDRDSGAIVSLASDYTGVILATATDTAGVLDLAYPVKAFYPLRLASRYSKARIDVREHEVKISYESLEPSRDDVLSKRPEISATITLRAAPDNRSVILACAIENRSSLPIPQVLFPDFSGLRPFLGPKDTVLRFASGLVQPFAARVIPSDSAPFYAENTWNTYQSGGYYGINTLRWIDIGGYRAGLSIFEARWGTDYPPAVLTRRSESESAALRLVWEHRDGIKPGQRWQSADYWLTPHLGGWAKGIDVFKNYVAHANGARVLPKHVAEGLGFRMLWMSQELETKPSRAYFHYSDLPAVAKDAKRYGIDEIVLWGWSEFFSPLDTTALTSLGKESELLAGIREARQSGVNITPFYSFQTVLNRYSERYGVKADTSRYTYHSELIPVFNPFYVDVDAGAWVENDNKVWQHDVEDTLMKWISAGSPSICYDQFSSAVPSDSKHSFMLLAARLRARAQQLDAESTFCGESIANGGLERDGQLLDYTWNWVDYEDSGPVLNVLGSPRLNCNIDHSILEAEKCFSAGLYLNLMPRKPDQANGSSLLGEYPAFAENIKRLAALRKQFLSFFRNGVYLGDSIRRQSAAGFVASYQLDNRILVIVVNDTPKTTALDVSADLRIWLPNARTFRVTTYSGSGRQGPTTRTGPNWRARTPVLAPANMAVFEIAS